MFEWKKRTTPVDDASKPLTIVQVRKLRKDPRTNDPSFRLATERAIGSYSAAIRSGGRFQPIFLLPALIYIAVMYLLDQFHISTPVRIAAQLAVLIPLVFLMPKVMHMMTRSAWRRIGQPMVADAICASCAYDMSGQEAQPDATVRCPECESTWKEDAVVHLHRQHHSTTRAATVEQLKRLYDQNPWRWPRAGRDDRRAHIPMMHKPIYKLAAFVSSDDKYSTRLKHIKPAMDRLQRIYRDEIVAWSGAIILAVLCQFFFLWTIISSSGRRAVVLTPFGYINWFYIGLACVVALLLVGIVLLTRRRSRAFAAAARDFVQHNVCPSCAADMTNAHPEDDGCVVCTTCRAAWNVPPALENK